MKLRVRFFQPLFLFFLFLMIYSCSKQYYTDEDARKASEESRKIELTVLIKDVSNVYYASDMSGFSIKTFIDGSVQEVITTSEGYASIKMKRGESLLTIEKEGFSKIKAIVDLSKYSDYKSAVTLIPISGKTEEVKTISGRVLAHDDFTKPMSNNSPIQGALVTVNFNMSELFKSLFTGTDKEFSTYCNASVSYEDSELLQAVRTGSDGEFSIKIPASLSEVHYSLIIPEISTPVTLFYSDRFDNPVKQIKVQSFVSMNKELNQYVLENLAEYVVDGNSTTAFSGVHISVSAPDKVTGRKEQAYIRAIVDEKTGEISQLVVYDQDTEEWKTSTTIAGKGYESIPTIKVNSLQGVPIKSSQIEADVLATGELRFKIIEKGEGYKTNFTQNATGFTNYNNLLNYIILTNGQSNHTVNIALMPHIN